MAAIREYQMGTAPDSTDFIKERIQNYWSLRSENFSGLRKQELECDMAVLWQNEIEKYLPTGKSLKILDVGTGSGFFAILLAGLGHQTTGIDLTPSMIEEARKLAADQNAKADFFVMDAENPDFADESFDVVISRNLTWTLPHPEQAYAQWMRVLKKDGILLNFDADYGNAGFSDYSALPTHHAHKIIGDSMLAECDAIKAQLDISRYMRPVWDIHTLLELGMEEIQIDTGISRRIYTKQDAFYNPTPMFALCAIKR
ncbi:MAG: class I SAM-dependent methyltransferase [Lachnospiraceae bacterium]|nr:class I SAM-dependent methyltransferase [Lachnospiraceae bacterium]